MKAEKIPIVLAKLSALLDGELPLAVRSVLHLLHAEVALGRGARFAKHCCAYVPLTLKPEVRQEKAKPKKEVVN